MPVPKYYEMQRPFLEALKDGNQHAMKDVVKWYLKKVVRQVGVSTVMRYLYDTRNSFSPI